MKRVTNVNLNYSSESEFLFPSRKYMNQSLKLPCYFELDGIWQIKFLCANCCTEIYWGRVEDNKWNLDKLSMLQIPFSKYYDKKTLTKLNELFYNTILKAKDESLSLKLHDSTPNLALINCQGCNYRYFITFFIGIGIENRPPLPNTIGINEIVGTKNKIIPSLCKV